MLGADLLVSASNLEGLPVGVLEAAYCGCDLLLSDIAPHVEVQTACPWVRLFCGGSVESLVAGLEEFKSRYSGITRVERAATVKHYFSLNSMLQRYDEEYFGILEASR